MPSPFVIVGGGLAAATAAEELRTRGHDGAFAHPAVWEAEHDITLHTGVAVRRIGDHVVERLIRDRVLVERSRLADPSVDLADLT